MKQRDDWHLTDLLDYEHGRGDPFAAAVRATRMPMVITDPAQPDNPIVFCNESFQKLTGYERDEIIGTRSPKAISGGRQRIAVYQPGHRPDRSVDDPHRAADANKYDRGPGR